MTREMGMGHAELFRNLPAAIEFRAYAVVKDRILIKEENRAIEIWFSAPGERRLGAMRLPVTRLDFSFSGYSSHEINAFMTRFDLYFRRGGG